MARSRTCSSSWPLILALQLAFLAHCLGVTMLRQPAPTAPAGICAQRCAPSSLTSSAPVLVPPVSPGVFAVWYPLQHRIDLDDRTMIPVVLRGGNTPRAPPARFLLFDVMQS